MSPSRTMHTLMRTLIVRSVVAALLTAVIAVGLSAGLTVLVPQWHLVTWAQVPWIVVGSLCADMCRRLLGDLP